MWSFGCTFFSLSMFLRIICIVACIITSFPFCRWILLNHMSALHFIHLSIGRDINWPLFLIFLLLKSWRFLKYICHNNWKNHINSKGLESTHGQSGSDLVPSSNPLVLNKVQIYSHTHTESWQYLQIFMIITTEDMLLYLVSRGQKHYKHNIKTEPTIKELFGPKC